MAETKYIPNGSFLICDKGSIPTQLRVTHNAGTRIYGQQLASEADVIPMVNIPPFGTCSITGSACSFSPIYWDRCNPDALVNGLKLVYKDSYLLCTVGGKAEVDFETPPFILAQMAEQLGEDGNWVLGLAIGNEQGLRTMRPMVPYAQQAADARPNLNAATRAASGAAKEAFGENLSKLDFQAQGYAVTGTPHGRPFEPGIDVVARDPRANIDILEETKFKSGPGRPYTARTTSSRQGSSRWFDTRLDGRVPPADAARIRGRLRTNSPDLVRTVTKVTPSGELTRFSLNPDGSTGAQMSLPPATVVRPGTAAGDFINDVGRNIQSNGRVAGANRWLTQNAQTVSRVGKVVGRGAAVVGIAADGYNIYTAYQEEG